jgi:hypothetical protein
MKKKLIFVSLPIILIFYTITFSRYITEIDCGELLSVQSTYGIAHPSGYPLFTLLGYLITKLPINVSNIIKLNYLATIYVFLSIIVFIFLLKLLFENISLFQNEIKIQNKKEKKKLSQNIEKIVFNDSQITISILFSSLILAFSRTYWLQSTSTEVYSLHLLLVNLTMYTFFYAYLTEFNLLKWLIFGIALGLGFSNHLTIFQLLPALLYLFFKKYGLNKKSFKDFFYIALTTFFISVFWYLLIYFNAQNQPLFNWGNPITFEALKNHITGWQYRVWLFKGLDVFIDNFLNKYVYNIGNEFFVLFIIVAAVGFYYSYKKLRLLFIALTTTFLFNIFYSCNYSITDLDNYFLLSYIVLAIFIALGIVHIHQQVVNVHRISYYFSGVLLLFLLVQIYQNYEYVDRSNYSVIEDYSREYLKHVDKNSIILTYQWDILVSPSYYLQFIEKYHKNIAIIDKELLRRTWYFSQLRKMNPIAYKIVEKDSKEFVPELLKFETGQDYDGEFLEYYYRKMQVELITSDKFQKCYIGPEFLANEIKNGIITIPQGYQLVPDLFSFIVIKGNQYVPANLPDYTIRFPKVANRYSKLIYNICGEMLVRRIMYELQFNKIEKAKIYYKKLSTEFKEFPVPSDLKKLMEADV